jgi:hypothetical protein
VTTEYALSVTHRINRECRPPGLYIVGANYKVWVKQWSELIRDCEVRLDFVQQKPRVEISKHDSEQRIGHLHESNIKAARTNHRGKDSHPRA